MALAIKHNFVSLKADGTDPTVLKPSYWNDGHAITLAALSLVGNSAITAGAAVEIPISTAVINLLPSVDLPTLLAAMGITLPTTGDGVLTLKTTPSAGWLLMDDGTFGNAGSGASNRANADCQALFTLLYNNLLDAAAPVQTSVGGASSRAAQGSAATAWAANCRMVLPKQLGRAIVGAGTGSGLAAKPLGGVSGSDTGVLQATNLPPITSTNPAQAISVGSTPTNVVQGVQATNGSAGGGGAGLHTLNSDTYSAIASTGNNAITVTSTGTNSTPVSLTQASAAWNVMVKL